MTARMLYRRHLSHRERSALALLRSGGCLAARPDIADAFAALLTDARAVGLTVLEHDSPVVHGDERKLLALLTLAQRHSDVNGTEPLAHALRRCATLLGGIGCRLDHRSAVHLLGRGGAPEARPLQHRVVRFLTDKEAVATHDLNAIGASNQFIRTLRSQGVLRRVRHGFYALNRVDGLAA